MIPVTDNAISSVPNSNRTPRMWVQMELVAMATDLAEFLGAALGFNQLLGIPLFPAGVLTTVVTFLILGLERYGFRPLEAVIGSLVGVVAVCYLVRKRYPTIGAPREIASPAGAGPRSVNVVERSSEQGFPPTPIFEDECI